MAGIWWIALFALLGLLARGSAHAIEITLAWGPVSEASGYKIYYGTQSDRYTTAVDVGDATSYRLTLDAGHTYYLAATAYDEEYIESDFSDEIKYSAVCSLSLSARKVFFDSSGGSGSFTVTAPDGCSWSASTGASWITITSGANGSGSGSVEYTTAAKTVKRKRRGRIVVRLDDSHKHKAFRIRQTRMKGTE